MGKLGVVITTYRGQGQFLETLLHVLAATDKKSDIVVVSDSDSFGEVPLGECIHYVSTEVTGSGFAKAANLGVKALNGEEYVAILHDDIALPDGFSFEPLIRKMENDEHIGLIVPMLLKPRNTTVESFAMFMVSRGQQIIKSYYNNWYPEYPAANEEQEVDVAKSPFMFFRRSVWEEVGGFDEEFSPFSFEDFDITLRVKQAGYSAIYYPKVKAIHHQAKTINNSLEGFDIPSITQANLDKFKEKWGSSPLMVWKKDDV
jgi:GT2 family glycosyltransferase